MGVNRACPRLYDDEIIVPGITASVVSEECFSRGNSKSSCRPGPCRRAGKRHHYIARVKTSGSAGTFYVSVKSNARTGGGGESGQVG